MASKKDDGDFSTTETLVQGHAPASVVPTSEVVPELIADRYSVLGLVGRGAMGAVYRARDTELDEVVALKVLSHELGNSPASIERFRREVKLARRVTHPNVARTFDIGEHSGIRFLTMEFIEGESLSDEMQKKGGPLSLGRVMEVATEICAGLAAAHRAGVVHRDLKPDNVMVASDGRVVITDFGIARDPMASADPKHTMGGIVGTPAYMSPEQVEARPDIDARSDVFAFGVMLFELLTGELPFKGESVLALAAARLYSEAPTVVSVRPEIPVGISQVVQRCLARDITQRYADASEIALDLAKKSPTLRGGIAPASVVSEPVAIPNKREKTVAVLPFRNVGAAEDDYVAEGLGAELIDNLSMTAGLRVRPQGSVARYKGVDRDPRDIGRELDVEVIAEGSVRRMGDRVRLTARLTSVEDGFQLWAQRFDRPANDLLVMSDETAQAIARALTLESQPQHGAELDTIAVDLYLRARSESQRLGAAHVRTAIDLFRAAHERAPNDVRILAGLARACARDWFFRGSASQDVAETARALARRAVSDAPDLPEALLALATVNLMERDPKGAAVAARRALEVAPWSPDALEFVARMLNESGRPELALVKLEAALQLDPTMRAARLEYIRAHAVLGNFERVLEILRPAPGAPDDEGDAIARARVALWSPIVLASMDEVQVPDYDQQRLSPWRVVQMQQSVARGERQDETIAEMAFIAQQASGSARFATLMYQLLTEMCVHLGRPEEAIGWLEKAVQCGLADLSWIDGKTPVARLAQHPRFQELRAPVADCARQVQEALGV